jgi:hypothetical protein
LDSGCSRFHSNKTLEIILAYTAGLLSFFFVASFFGCYLPKHDAGYKFLGLRTELIVNTMTWKNILDK